jgi:hypothetical protein
LREQTVTTLRIDFAHRGVAHYAPSMSTARRITLSVAALASFALLVPSIVSAHFVLEDPMSWWSQDGLGSPQKLGPCGDEGPGSATNAVTAYMTGSTINITIHEIIFHPGHYRVALALHDRSELPPEPVVTPASTPCGSVPIMNPPVFPVLADGMLLHTSPLSGPQTFQVTLPAGMTCTHCTLQVIEFMSNHALNNPGGCFYHHCADISIQDVVVQDAATVDAGVASFDAGMDSGPSPAARAACACRAGTRAPSTSALAVGSLVVLVSRWRRRRVR